MDGHSDQFPEGHVNSSHVGRSNALDEGMCVLAVHVIIKQSPMRSHQPVSGQKRIVNSSEKLLILLVIMRLLVVHGKATITPVKRYSRVVATLDATVFSAEHSFLVSLFLNA